MAELVNETIQNQLFTMEQMEQMFQMFQKLNKPKPTKLIHNPTLWKIKLQQLYKMEQINANCF